MASPTLKVPNLQLPKELAVVVKDDLERTFQFTCPRSVLQAFSKGLTQRRFQLTVTIADRIPIHYRSCLSKFSPLIKASGTEAPAVDDEEAIAVLLYFYLTFGKDEPKILQSLERLDFEDGRTKRLLLKTFPAPFTQGCLGVSAVVGTATQHQTLVLLDSACLRHIASQPPQRAVFLNQRKLKTGEDVEGEWHIHADFLATVPPKERRLDLAISIRSRTSKLVVAQTTCTIPQPPEEEDDLPDPVILSPLRLLQGSLTPTDPLPRDPAKIPLPKPIARGPQLKTEAPPVPPPTVDLHTPGDAKPTYRLDPLNFHISQDSFARDGKFGMWAFFTIHAVGQSLSEMKNNSLKRAPRAFFEQNGQRVLAEETCLGVMMNSDLRWPEYSWCNGNLVIPPECGDQMIAVRMKFVLQGEPGNDNFSRARIPPWLQQPLTVNVELVEEQSQVRYSVTMSKVNPPVEAKTLERLKADWGVEDFALFLYADDCKQDTRHFVGCYREKEYFVVRTQNQSTYLDLNAVNRLSFEAAKTHASETAVDIGSSNGVQCVALIDHSQYPPMAYALKFIVSTSTSYAEGSCHFAFEGQDWIDRGENVLPPSQATSTTQEAERDQSSSLPPSVEASQRDEAPSPTHTLSSQPQPTTQSQPKSSILNNRFTVVYGECLGSGAYGTVYKGFDNDLGQFVAVKECNLAGEGVDATKLQKSIMSEYRTLTQLNHPNIVRVLDLQVTGTTVRIIMDWLASGSVSAILHRTHHRLHEQVVRKFAYDAIKGLSYLHSVGMMHLDIKPANLLVDSAGGVKLADFGTSRLVNGTGSSVTTQRIVGTPAYMSPEMITGGAADAACDIWALACSIVEISSGQMPWYHLDERVRQAAVPLMFHIGTATPPNHHPLIPPHLSGALKGILERCFSPVPNLRPSADSLLRDAYFNDPSLPDDAEALEHFRETVVSEVNESAAGGSNPTNSWEELSLHNTYSSTKTGTVSLT